MYLQKEISKCLLINKISLYLLYILFIASMPDSCSCFVQYFVFCVISASELDVPEDNNDEVDADLFWNQVCLAMVYRGFLHTGMYTYSKD